MPITVEWGNTSRVHHAMKYYTAVKKNELSPCAITWMNLQSVMLSEKKKKKKQTQKGRTCVIPF